MKSIRAALAILFTTLAPLALGCAAQTGDEPMANVDEALMNNGEGPQGPSMDDLLAAGYHCVAIDVPATPLACGKDGSDNVYLCNPYTRVCVPAPTNAKPAPPILVHHPISGPFKTVQ